MGDLTKGKTFVAAEVVTPAKLHQLVEDAEIKAGAVGTTEIADGAVTSAKLASGLALSVSKITLANGKVMVGNGSGVGAEVTVDTGTMDAAGFGVKAGGIGTTQLASNAVTTAKIADGNVTLAKVANIATARILGRSTAGSGVPEELTAGAGISISGGAVSCTVTGVSRYVSSLAAIPGVEAVSSFTHGLGATPNIVQTHIECITADAPYSVGDRIPVQFLCRVDDYFRPIFGVSADATTVRVARYSSGTPVNAISESDGRTTTIDTAKWNLRVVAII